MLIKTIDPYIVPGCLQCGGPVQSDLARPRRGRLIQIECERCGEYAVDWTVIADHFRLTQPATDRASNEPQQGGERADSPFG
jgi:hypothetical protein